MTTHSSRFVSRLTSHTLALVLAGGRGSRLGVLTDWRTKPAVPFGGKFRIIDFSLSNCINSNIRRVGVLTQYKSHALIQHILQGWNRFNSEQGEFIDIVPAQQWLDENSWYKGTADAVFQNLDIIRSYAPEYVLVLAGDHIYKMDYGEMLGAHVESGADFTIACNTVSVEEAKAFGVMQVDSNKRIVDFVEKPENPTPLPNDPNSALASMGIYVFSLEYLKNQLLSDAEDSGSSHDFGKDIIPKALQAGHHLQAYTFQNPDKQGVKNYWKDVGTLDAYFESNMEIISENPPLNIYDSEWPILTYQPQLPPANFIRNTHMTNSIVSGGCTIDDSTLVHSMLFSNVSVGAGSELSEVLALPDCHIGKNCRLNHVLLDNKCHVPDNTTIGFNEEDDRKRFTVTEDGLVVVNRKMLGQQDRYFSPYSDKSDYSKWRNP
jgi:glucose-1-phosphate adenylyltransferase